MPKNQRKWKDIVDTPYNLLNYKEKRVIIKFEFVKKTFFLSLKLFEPNFNRDVRKPIFIANLKRGSLA